MDRHPWKVTKGRRNWFIRDKDNNYICDVLNKDTAYRIAASPELILALEGLSDGCFCLEGSGYGEGFRGGHMESCARARAALAKARGEEGV